MLVTSIHVGYVCQLHALILASLSIGNVCYLIYILDGEHINKLIASFQTISKVNVQVYFWHLIVNDLQQS